MSALTYCVIALLAAMPDAILCYALKRRFRAGRCLVLGALWPVTIPLVIVASAVMTRSFPNVEDAP